MHLNNNLNIQDIYEYIFPMLKKIYLKYTYVNINDDDIKVFLMNKINKNIGKIKDVNHFADFVKKKFLVYIENQVNNLEISDLTQGEDNDENMSDFSTESISDEFYFDDLVKEIIIRSSKHPLLNDDEQKTLIKMAQSGDDNAKELLVERNSRLIISIAKKYSGKGVDFLDLYQEGVIGFINAINKFDLEKDNTLSTYAVWWIKNSILKCINMNARTIRLPIHDIERIHKINAIQNEYFLKYNRKATVEELAELLKLSIQKIEELISDKEVISLNNKLDSSETEFEDLTENGETSLEDQIIEQDANNRLRQLIESTLTVREKHVIIHRFGFYGNSAKTLEEIGRLLGVTRENIRKVESKALYKLQIALANDNRPNTIEMASKKDLEYVSLYDYFNKYSKYLIDKMVANLDKESVILLKLRFGSNFSTINPYVSWQKEEYDKLKLVLKKLKKLFDVQMMNTPRFGCGYRNIYYYFENYSKIEIDDAIDQLGVKDLLFLEEIFGTNFEKPNANPDESKIRDRKFYQIKHKITYILKGNTRTIYKIFSNFTESQVNEAIALLSDNERYIIRAKFGDNLNEIPKNGCWISEYHAEFNIIKKKIYNILLSNYPEREAGEKVEITETETLTLQDIDEDQTLEFAKNPIVLKSVLNMMPRLEVMVLEMKYGLKGEKFSNSEISEALKISEEEIIVLLQQALTRYKEIFSSIASDFDKNNSDLILSRNL